MLPYRVPGRLPTNGGRAGIYQGGVYRHIYPGGVYRHIYPGGIPSGVHTQVVYPAVYIPRWCIAVHDTRVVYSRACYPGGVYTAVYIPGWYLYSGVHTRVGNLCAERPPSLLVMRESCRK